MSSTGLVQHRDDPLFTIAIPTFNRASLLKDCVASALAQTYEGFEVLVSDNASTDATEAMLSQFDDDKLRVVRQATNIGLIPNWNACLAAARGEYIIFVSDDDRITPWFLQRCVDVMSRRPQVPIIVSLSNLDFVSLGRTIPARTSSTCQTGIWDGTTILTEFLTDRITVTMCGVVMRTDLLRAQGGFSSEYPHAADIAAWAPMLFLGEVGFVNEPCAVFALHNKSETARMWVDQVLRDGCRMTEFISSLADQHLTDPDLRKTIKAQARRCFARRGLIALSDYWKGGGDTRKLIAFLWTFRHCLGSVDLRAALRFGATVLCPPDLANWFRRFKPSVWQHHA
jgi:hypothetical protein